MYVRLSQNPNDKKTHLIEIIIDTSRKEENYAFRGFETRMDISKKEK